MSLLKSHGILFINRQCVMRIGVCPRSVTRSDTNQNTMNYLRKVSQLHKLNFYHVYHSLSNHSVALYCVTRDYCLNQQGVKKYSQITSDMTELGSQCGFSSAPKRYNCSFSQSLKSGTLSQDHFSSQEACNFSHFHHLCGRYNTRLNLLVQYGNKNSGYDQHIYKRSFSTTALKSNKAEEILCDNEPPSINHVNSESRQFINVTHNGRKHEIAYMDVGPRDGQIALAIHGLPGSFKDFDTFVDSFVSAGMRVLAYDSPGGSPNSTIEDIKSFDFSSDNRAALTLAFMDALDIEKVDVLIGHSAGSVVVYYLCALTDRFHSCVILNPVCHTPHSTLRPQWLIHLSAALFRIPLLGSLLQAPLSFRYKRAGFTITDPVQVRSSFLSVSAFDFQKHAEYATVISRKQLPTLLLCSKSDRIVEWPIPLGMIKLLCLDQISHNAEGVEDQSYKVNHGVTNERFAKALLFERGGHFAHRKYHHIFMTHIIDLIETIKKN